MFNFLIHCFDRSISDTIMAWTCGYRCVLLLWRSVKTMILNRLWTCAQVWRCQKRRGNRAVGGRSTRLKMFASFTGWWCEAGFKSPVFIFFRWLSTSIKQLCTCAAWNSYLNLCEAGFKREILNSNSIAPFWMLKLGLNVNISVNAALILILKLKI
jgi:hypothetical protein